MLEISETNAQGDTLTHAKLEVWADSSGCYYVKGLEGLRKDQITVNDGKAAIADISGDNTPAKKVYLKRIIR